MCARPTISSCAAPVVRARWSFRASVLYSISWTRELLPDPLTPVTAINEPSGNRTSMFFKLFWRAPLTTNHWVDDAPSESLIRRFVGIGIAFLLDKYWPVRDAFERTICFGGP